MDFARVLAITTSTEIHVNSAIHHALPVLVEMIPIVNPAMQMPSQLIQEAVSARMATMDLQITAYSAILSVSHATVQDVLTATPMLQFPRTPVHAIHITGPILTLLRAHCATMNARIAMVKTRTNA